MNNYLQDDNFEVWEKVLIEDVILDIGDGGTPPRNKTEYFSGNIPWVVVRDIRPKIKVTSDSLSVEGLKKSSAKLWPKKTVILSFGATIGEVGIAEVELATKQGIAGIVPNQSKITSEFLYYFLSTQKNKLSQLASGSTIKEVRPNVIKKIKLLLPSIPEQKKIAEILACVDEDIEKTDEIIKKTQKLKKGLMRELFSGKAVKNYEVVKIQDLIDRGIIEKNQDGNHGNDHPKSSDFVDSGIPFITAADVKNGKIDLIKCKYIKKEQADKLRIGFSKEGDIILTHKGTVGLVGMVENIITDYLMLSPQTTYYRCNSVKLYYRYLYYYFQSDYFQDKLKNIAKQSTRDYLSITHQRILPVVFFEDMGEQKRIAEILSAVDDKIDIYKQIKSKITELKKGLMQDLLSGEVRVKI